MRVSAVEEGNPSGSLVVAGLGTFDGVHRAHRAMLSELRRVATDKDAEVGLLLIEGGAHYRARMLTSLEHRLELLAETGDVDAVWVVPSDIHEDPRLWLGAALDAVHPIALGVSGLMRLGRADLTFREELDSICAEHSIEIFSMDESNPGRHEAARRSTRPATSARSSSTATSPRRTVLGRLFEMRGEVEHGDHRGRTFGVPTVNLSIHSTLLIPKEGVYAGVALLPDGSAVPAVSLGRRATFYEEAGSCSRRI